MIRLQKIVTSILLADLLTHWYEANGGETSGKKSEVLSATTLTYVNSVSNYVSYLGSGSSPSGPSPEVPVLADT
jgi:hypothetical protein